MRGPSVQGARRSARGGVLEQYVEHGEQAQRSNDGPMACFTASGGDEMRASASRLTARASRRGMTLVEVIVAMSLLGLLSAGLFTAFQIGVSSAWLTTREEADA